MIKKVWKFVLLVLLLLLTFSYAMFQGGFVSWFLFYSFLPFAIYCTALSLYSLNGLKVSRVLPKTDYSAGEPLTVTIEVSRPYYFPLFYLLIEDQLPVRLKDSGDSSSNKSLLYPGLKKQVTHEYRIESLPRGEHPFQSISLTIGDPLGLFEKTKVLLLEDKITVYPAYTELLYRPLEQQYEQGLTASRERVQRDTTMAVAVREYQPGDRFSWINWKATAKRNDIMTKEFEQRQSNDVLLIMDCTPDNNFEVIVSFTASLLRSILKKGAQAGLLTISDERSAISIRGGEQQLRLIYNHLARVEASGGFSFDKVLETESHFIQQTVSYMLVTANLTKPLVEKASFLGQRKGKINLFLIKGKKQAPTAAERSLAAAASLRGVRVSIIHEGHFAAAFSGVTMW